MKKTKRTSRRPLTLNKETLKNLSTDGQRVAGGTWAESLLCPPIEVSVFCPTGAAMCTLLSRPCPPGGSLLCG